MIDNLPLELRERPQWCISGADKIPKYVAGDRILYAKTNDPNTWMRFEDAVKEARARRMNIGFVLHETDPFTCIDLDVKDAVNAPDTPSLWTTKEQFDLYYRIMSTMESYCETSVGGKGLHIWVGGNIGKGVRRDGVEVYSQERYIICTGSVVKNLPIAYRQELLLNMVSQMRDGQLNEGNAKALEMFEVEADEQDWWILKTAWEAENGEKFERLWLGRWDGEYPSQSEADVALMSMLAFYSRSNEQCRRLFRESGLGEREKAIRNDLYLNRTLGLIRRRQASEIEAAKRAAEMAATVVKNMGGKSVAVMQDVIAAEAAPVNKLVSEAKGGMEWPPGFAGSIAKWIYSSAPRPVKEVAIVATIGMLAGICGKAWHIPQSGLNMYIILIAKSAVGKEAMHSGLAAIIAACSKKMPIFHQFFDFKEYASGQALIKACTSNPSFVNVCGEWGRKLKRLSNDDTDGPMQTLRTQMTNMYQKSGPQSVVGGIAYSDKANNIDSVSGVAYSMIGESTPSTFYESLTTSMMEDGFLSRFLIVHYDGDRPPLNRVRADKLDLHLEEGLCKLAFHAKNILNNNSTQEVEFSNESYDMLDSFERLCDHMINGSDEESFRQMWNRAALKATRLAALLAVADNWINPVIESHHLEWAIAVVKADITNMSSKLKGGDIGLNDDTRLNKLMEICASFMAKPPIRKDVPESLINNHIIPKAYILGKVKNVPAFNRFSRGAIAAADLTIKAAIENGWIVEVSPVTLRNEHSYFGKAYRVLVLP